MQFKSKAYIELSLAMFIAGSSVVASKLLVQTLPVFLASEIALLIALVILIPIAYKEKNAIPKVDNKTFFILFLQSLTGVFLFRVFLFYGLKYTSAVESGLITSTSPAVIGIMAFFILKEKPSLNKIVGILLVVMGLLIVNTHANYVLSNSNNPVKGNILVLIAIVGEALFSVLSKVTNNIPAIYRTTVITFFAAICFIPFSIYDALHFDLNQITGTALLSVVYYGTFVSVISYVLWFRGISKVSASNAAVYAGMMPVSSIILSSIILRESIMPSHIISLIFILLGIIISSLNKLNHGANNFN